MLLFDGAGEVVDGAVVPAFLAINAAIGGLDVSQHHVVVGIGENRLRLHQRLERFLVLAFLEQQPALEHPHHRGHAREPAFEPGL